MNTDDVNTLSWLEDFRQKLEAICMEAENQVLSATDGVINFCSHTMEDLLPPVSDDPMTPEYYPALCSGHNFYPAMSDKAEMIIMRNYLNSVKDEQNIEIGSKKLGGDTNRASDLNASGSRDLSEELIKHESEEKFHGDESVLLCKDDDHTARECKMCNQTDLTLETIDSAEASLSPIISSPGPIIFDEHKNGGYMSDSDESDAEDDGIESNADVLSNLSLNDESCVLVNESEPFSTAHVQGKQRSYKKKIMDLFNLRRCSSTKNQVQQDTDSSSQESAQIVDSVSIESGWEIL